jgi:hypothetical protein
VKLTNQQETEISIYSPLTEGLSLQIQSVMLGKRTSAGVNLLNTPLKPSPYVQVGMPNDKNQLTLEACSNTFLETKLTDWQAAQLQEVGWAAPDKTNPNFWMVTDSQDTAEMSKVMVYAMHLVFGLRPDTWFTFGTAPLDEAMNNSGLFWHMKGKTGVVCLPGQNKDRTVEGGLRG